MGSLLTPLPYRACDLCQFGEGPQGARRCGHPEATYRQAVPVEIVRAFGGSCGPDAKHLHVESWGRSVAKRSRALSPDERRKLADMRELLAACERFGYKASAHELRRKIDALVKGKAS